MTECWARFPRIKAEDIDKQVRKIDAEVDEVYIAHYRHEGDEHLAEELVDVIHACETALWLLADKGVDIEKTFAYVQKKNRARGYYRKADEDGK